MVPTPFFVVVIFASLKSLSPASFMLLEFLSKKQLTNKMLLLVRDISSKLKYPPFKLSKLWKPIRIKPEEVGLNTVE